MENHADVFGAAQKLSAGLDRSPLGIFPCDEGDPPAIVSGSVLRCPVSTQVYEVASSATMNVPGRHAVSKLDAGCTVVASGPPETQEDGAALVPVQPKGFVMLADVRADLNDFSIFDRIDMTARTEFLSCVRRSIKAERAIGAMVGLAVADSVGAVFEMLPILEAGYSFDPKTLEYTSQLNRFGLSPGQWTDDTSMALCLADSLLVCGDYNGTDIRIRFWNWWYQHYNNGFRFDGSRCKSIGIGGNIKTSLLAITNASPTARFGDGGEDAGNGSLMRLAPVPIFFHMDEELAMSASAESSLTTHPGSLAADACEFLSLVIVRALTRDAGCKQTAAQFLDACAAAYLARPGVTATKLELTRLLLSQEPAGSLEPCWNWRDPAGPFLEETLAARGCEYNGFPVSASYFGSFCLDGLAIALHSMYHTGNFMDAIAKCVNFLGDADTMAAICAQMAGAFYGIRGVDSRLIANLEQWDKGEVALRAALLCELGAGRTDADNKATRKILHDIAHGS